MPDYRKATRRAAIKHGISPDIFERQIGAESNFDPTAGSPAGAQGIAQFMPATAKGMGVNLSDNRVGDDLDGAARLMANYLRKYGNYKDALTAYNAGPGRVGKPLYRETQDYIQKILGGSNPQSAPGRTPARTPSTPQRAPQSAPAALGGATAGDSSNMMRQALLANFLRAQGDRSPLPSLLEQGALTAGLPAPPQNTIASSIIRNTNPRAGNPLPTPTGGGASRAVSEAAARLGVGEIGSSNRGARLDTWQRKYGMLGQPWCGIFVGLSLEKAGVKGVNSRVASVQAIEQDARLGRGAFRKFVEPNRAQPGDALITAPGKHVGLVEKVDRERGIIHTIEGNTSNGKVQRVQRKISEVYGAARPRYS